MLYFYIQTILVWTSHFDWWLKCLESKQVFGGHQAKSSVSAVTLLC